MAQLLVCWSEYYTAECCVGGCPNRFEYECLFTMGLQAVCFLFVGG